MAQRNELAHRIDCKLALPFLDVRAEANDNTGWLSTYLLMIANASGARSVRQGDLDRCTALAAQYLYKTGWFDGASLRELAHVGNKLNKHLHLPACMEAIAWIAGQLERAKGPLRLDGKSYALLLNAFAKNTDSRRCERAVARVARHLHDSQDQHYLNPLGISLALNAFSKWFDNQDCRTMAHSLAERLASSSQLRNALTETQLRVR